MQHRFDLGWSSTELRRRKGLSPICMSVLQNICTPYFLFDTVTRFCRVKDNRVIAATGSIAPARTVRKRMAGSVVQHC